MKVGYMELSDKMELHSGVTIAEFDASVHKVPEQVKHMVQGYPTLILFPSGRGGEPEPVMYKGERDRDAMAAWMEAAAPTIQSNRALRDKIKVCLVPGFGMGVLTIQSNRVPLGQNQDVLEFFNHGVWSGLRSMESTRALTRKPLILIAALKTCRFSRGNRRLQSRRRGSKTRQSRLSLSFSLFPSLSLSLSLSLPLSLSPSLPLSLSLSLSLSLRLSLVLLQELSAF
jgi:hypothetical protein